MLERAPKELMGGNSRFTAGAFRCVYDGVDDLKAIMPDLTKEEIDRSDFGTYTSDQFYDDMFRITQFRTDGDLCDRLVGRSRDAMRWLHKKGMQFDPIWGRQAYLIDGKFKFWGGLTVEAKGGGPGLVEQHLKLAEKSGIEIRYGTRAFELIYDGNVVRLSRTLKPSKRGELEITDVNATYLKQGQLSVEIMGRGYAWLDTGTHDSLQEAASFIATLQKRQGLMVACPEEIAFMQNWIDAAALQKLATPLAKNGYGQYLLSLLK